MRKKNSTASAFCCALSCVCPVDIPDHTTMQKCILDTFSDVIQDMSEHIQVILSCDLMVFG